MGRSETICILPEAMCNRTTKCDYTEVKQAAVIQLKL